jgi:hypothetical protein
VGPPGSGKSSYCVKLLKYQKYLYEHVVDKIIYVYSAWQTNYDELNALFGSKITFMCGMPPDFSIFKSCILVIDDQMNSLSDDFMQTVICNSHHKNVTLIVLVQELFANNYVKRVRKNSHYISFLKTPYLLDISIFARKIYTGSCFKAFMDGFKFVMQQKKYPHLLLDLHAETPDELRIRYDIFEHYSQVGTLNSDTIPIFKTFAI